MNQRERMNSKFGKMARGRKLTLRQKAKLMRKAWKEVKK